MLDRPQARWSDENNGKLTWYWMFPDLWPNRLDWLCIIPRMIPWPVSLSLCALCKHLEWIIRLLALFPGSLSLYASSYLLRLCNESALYSVLQVFVPRILRSHFEPKAADLATSRKIWKATQFSEIHSTLELTTTQIGTPPLRIIRNAAWCKYIFVHVTACTGRPCTTAAAKGC